MPNLATDYPVNQNVHNFATHLDADPHTALFPMPVDDSDIVPYTANTDGNVHPLQYLNDQGSPRVGGGGAYPHKKRLLQSPDIEYQATVLDMFYTDAVALTDETYVLVFESSADNTFAVVQELSRQSLTGLGSITAKVNLRPAEDKEHLFIRARLEVAGAAPSISFVANRVA